MHSIEEGVEADDGECRERYCGECTDREGYIAESQQDVEEHCDKRSDYGDNGVGAHVVGHAGTYLLAGNNAVVNVGSRELLGCDTFVEVGSEGVEEFAYNLFLGACIFAVDVVVGGDAHLVGAFDGDHRGGCSGELGARVPAGAPGCVHRLLETHDVVAATRRNRYPG